MLKTLKKRLKNERGLTLVELLAVIVILGIISAIAVPSIGGLVEKSKKDAAIADALQIISAAKLANAAEIVGPWEYDDLGKYISKAKDTSFTVRFNSDNGKYTIEGHEEAVAAIGGDATTGVTEQELVNKKVAPVKDESGDDPNN
ncbi:type II secretion system GspH family protein [Mesobacillus subterraneus]|uniref:type IV pilin protein n=1 Tax=Mesobacillus subterraneus TaxID=285983 RepID=UPI0020424C19|nr:type II secretion system protein [Mesobacillus subterraneus]MCM3663831.1 type II secretion system GspH family protein [Mesobacillus subterraneus]MCM3683592.1 type II secretion system GspH family protein [Mesobacillus subterraneus]